MAQDRADMDLRIAVCIHSQIVGFYNVGLCAFVCSMGLSCHFHHRPLYYGFNVLVWICCFAAFAIAPLPLLSLLYGSIVLLKFCESFMSPFRTILI